MKYILTFLLIFSSYTYALDANTFSSAVDQQRFTNLTKEIRCVVCQNQSIADSNAPLANDLRAKVYEMILENKSDADIKDYLVKRYGEFILLRPRITPTTLVLWAFPFLGLTSAIGFLLWHRRSRT